MFSILGLVDGIIKQIGKRSDISLLKIPVNKRISKNMVNSSRRCSCDSGRFIYGWYHAISISDIQKSCTFYFIHDQVDKG